MAKKKPVAKKKQKQVTLASLMGKQGDLFARLYKMDSSLKPLSQAQIAQKVTKSTPAVLTELDSSFNPLTEAQIAEKATSAINAQIAPQRAAITSAAKTQADTGAGAIDRASTGTANRLAGMIQPTQDVWSNRAKQTVDIGAAANALSAGAGSNALADLAKSLGAIGAPAESLAAAKTATEGYGAGLGKAASTDALTRLANVTDTGAAQTGLATLQPGLALRQGASQVGSYRAAADSALQNSLGSLDATIPGLVESTTGSLRNTELTKGQQRQSSKERLAEFQSGLESSLRNTELTKGQQRQSSKQSLAELAYNVITGNQNRNLQSQIAANSGLLNQQKANTSAKLGQQNANTSAKNASTSASSAATSAQGTWVSAGTDHAGYKLQQNNKTGKIRRMKRNGQPVRAQAKAKSSSGTTGSTGQPDFTKPKKPTN